MFESETQKYKALNAIAESNGIVIFGGKEDANIPIGELRQAFSIEEKLYNRSINSLSVKDAVSVYDAIVAPLDPETVLIHIGEADIEYFGEYPSDFDREYRELIGYIKSLNKKCRIVIISLKNYEKDIAISGLNKHLKYIAESERCEFEDISAKLVWNPKRIKDVISFVYDVGFVRPLKNKRPIYNLVEILFCYDPC